MTGCADCNKAGALRLLTPNGRAAIEKSHTAQDISWLFSLVDGAARLSRPGNGEQFCQFNAVLPNRVPNRIALTGDNIVGGVGRIEQRPLPVRVLGFGSDVAQRNPGLLQRA